MTADVNDPAYRDYLTKKYGIDKPPAERNDIVDAIVDAEEIAAQAFGHASDCAALFDPVRSPEMYAVADRAMRNLRDAMAFGDVAYDCHDGPDDPFDPGDLDDAAAYINFVGDRRLFVCRRGEHRRGPDYFADMLHVMSEVHPLWEVPCNVNLTLDCRGAKATRLYPLVRGQFVLLFVCCSHCLAHAGHTAQMGYTLSEMEARARVGLPLAEPTPPD
jgi:hypothetical protein